jgi:hypothetical protein
MCSSVKRSREVKKLPLNIDEELTSEQRLHFAAKANLAQARRDAAYIKNAEQPVIKLRCFNLFRWLKQYFLRS